MKYLSSETLEATAIGLAYNPGVAPFLDRHPGLIDYVEVPFEQLRHTPDVATLQEQIPLVLHCASMSVAGDAPPTRKTLDLIRHWVEKTRTPWIGEHLAYMSARAIETVAEHSDFLAGKIRNEAEPVSLHYTVCPQLTEETLEQTMANVRQLQAEFSVPIIFENSPQYFSIPRSTMSLIDFISRFYSTMKCGILLDLTHFVVSSRNMDYDPLKEIHKLPLDQIVEMHISGYSDQSGVAWDDHAKPASEDVFRLLEEVLPHCKPRAITFEYNWDANFPHQIITSQIERVRDLITTRRATAGLALV